MSDTSTDEPYRVMVADDSSVVRGLITRALESDPTIKVVASVADGEMAIRTVGRQPIEVVVLDIEMPNMDGITALPKLLEVNPNLKIVMASTLTQQNAEISMRALSLGAADYVAKPSTRELTSAEDFKRELTEKVAALGRAARGNKRPPRVTAAPAAAAPRPSYIQSAPVTLRSGGVMGSFDAIAIGSSTGGPQALFEVVKNLRGLRQPIFITQHMPATFTTILAQHITRHCNVPCAEAQEGEIVEAGRVYLAPGNHHMTARRFGTDVRIMLNQDPPENFCRPAVDPMLRSLSETYGKRLMILILTGMGSDGAKGATIAVNHGATLIAQDEASSVVWGMPGAAAQTGLCSAILPLAEIGPYIRQHASLVAA